MASLTRWIWLLVPVGIVWTFGKLVVTALTLWHQRFGELSREVFFYLPFLSVVPPILLLGIAVVQARRDPALRPVVFSREALPGDVWRGVVAGVLCVLAFVGSLRWLQSLGATAPDLSSLSLPHHLFFSTVGALVPGVAEEVYFRGFLMRRFRDLGPMSLVLLTSASFSLWHVLSPSYLLHTFVIGLILGFTLHRTGRLLPVMIGHTLANASAGVLIVQGLV